VFFNRSSRHVGVLGSGGIVPRILGLGTRWGGEWSASMSPAYTNNTVSEQPDFTGSSIYTEETPPESAN